ncbi:MAG: hypothetical protein ACFFD4_30195 [Candidatus Odinarchaeota archaeon]
MSKEARLLIIKQVKKEKESKKQDFSLQVDGFTKTVSSNPRAAYSLQDLLTYFDQIKNITLGFLDKTFLDFVTMTVRTLGSTAGDFPEGISIDDLIDTQETNHLKERIKELEERLAAGGGEIDADTELTIQDLKKEKESWMNRYEKFEASAKAKYKEYEEQIETLNSQVSESSENFKERLTEYMEELNNVQSEADELRRSNEKLNLQIDEIGKVMMTSEQEKDSLKSAIAERDKLIKQLNEQISRIPELENQNATLKDNVMKAADKIRQLKEELDAKGEVPIESPEMETEINELREELEELTKEHQILLEDTGQTSQAAKAYKEEIQNLKKNISILTEEKTEYEKKFGDLKQETELLKSKIDEEIIKAEKAIAERESTNRNMLSLRFELERTEKDLETTKKLVENYKSREKQLAEELAATTGTEFTIESLEREISRLKKQIEGLEEARKKEKAEYQEALDKNQERTDQAKKEADRFAVKIADLEEEIEGYRDNLGNLRQYLEENPKYAILFLVQDLKKAKIGEIQKALAVAPPITIKLIRSLENEGWIKITEDETEMEVEIIKDFIPD